MTLWIRVGTLLILAALQLSSMQILASASVPPSVLIASAIAWTVLLGFPAVLIPLFALILVTDGVLFGGVEPLSAYYIGIAYTTIFIMKRTLVGDRTSLSFLMLTLFSGAASACWPVFVWVSDLLIPMESVNMEPMSVGSLLLGGIIGCTVYPIVFALLSRSERMIREIRQDAQFSVK